MRIAVISSYPPKKCGIAEYSSQLVAALRTREIDVLVVGDEPSSSADVALNLGSRAGLSEVGRRIAEFGADVVHLQWEPGLFSRSARFLLPKWISSQPLPTVVTVHALAHVIERSPRGWISAISAGRAEKTLARARNAVFVFPSHMMKTLFHNRHPLRNGTVIPLGVSKMRDASEDFPPGFQLLSFGFIGPGKRLEIVVEMARRLPEWRFAVVGAPAGPRGEAYVGKLRRLSSGLSNFRIESGWISEAALDAEIDASVATVLPALAYHRASAAYTRSISRGVPVIACAGTSLGETVEATGSGIAAGQADVGAYVTAALRLHREWPAVRNGVRKAQSDFEWSATAEAHRKEYETISAGAPHQSS